MLAGSGGGGKGGCKNEKPDERAVVERVSIKPTGMTCHQQRTIAFDRCRLACSPDSLVLFDLAWPMGGPHGTATTLDEDSQASRSLVMMTDKRLPTQRGLCTAGQESGAKVPSEPGGGRTRPEPICLKYLQTRLHVLSSIAPPTNGHSYLM